MIATRPWRVSRDEAVPRDERVAHVEERRRRSTPIGWPTPMALATIAEITHM